MSDHLTNLARRALQPAAIHPRGQSRFEAESMVPRAPGSQLDERLAPSELATEPARQQHPQAVPTPAEPMPHVQLPQPNQPLPATKPVAELAALRPLPAHASSPVSEAAAVPQAVLQLTPDSLPPRQHDLQPPRIERLESQRVERQVREQTEIRRERIERQETLHSTIEQRVERLDLSGPRLPTPALPAAPLVPLPAAPGLQQAAAPRVEISIGRIEVLPLEPAAAPRREEAPRRPAAQTLDAYLEQRNGAEQGRGGRR